MNNSHAAHTFNLTDEIEASLHIYDGEFPTALITLDNGYEVGVEIADGKLRALIYRPEQELPQIVVLSPDVWRNANEQSG